METGRAYMDYVPSHEWLQDEAADTLVVHVPGFKKEQLRVHVGKDGKLLVSGERPLIKDQWSRFRKEFQLPENCNADQIHGKLENGLLNIVLPKLHHRGGAAKGADAVGKDAKEEKGGVKQQREGDAASRTAPAPTPQGEAVGDEKMKLQSTVSMDVRLQQHEGKLRVVGLLVAVVVVAWYLYRKLNPAETQPHDIDDTKLAKPRKPNRLSFPASCSHPGENPSISASRPPPHRRRGQSPTRSHFSLLLPPTTRTEPSTSPPDARGGVVELPAQRGQLVKPSRSCRRREDKMGEEVDKSFLARMLSYLRSSSKYYTGYPKDLGPSRVIHFTSERQFVQLLHEGRPVVVAFNIRSPYTEHLDGVLEEAAAKFCPHIKFMRVECPKYPGFCLTRQKKEYPFIEIFHSPEQTANQGKVVDPNVTKYAVKVMPFNYDVSVYGFREFFKKHGFLEENPSETATTDHH